MPKLVPLKPREIERILLKNGFILNHTTGSHKQYFNPQNKAHVTVPFHSRIIPKGTLKSIIRQSQLGESFLGDESPRHAKSRDFDSKQAWSKDSFQLHQADTQRSVVWEELQIRRRRTGDAGESRPACGQAVWR